MSRGGTETAGVMEVNRVYTAQQVAEKLGCCTRTVQKMAASGQIKHFKLGRVYRFTESAVNEFVGDAGSGQRAAHPTAQGN